MLSITRLIDTPKGGAKSVAAYMAATEYYREDFDGKPIFGSARWEGAGAVMLGLNKEGRNQNADFESLLKGYKPGGKPIVKNAGKKDRRMGWDLTFSADKTASLLFAAASASERTAILNAHHAAVRAAADFLMEGQICRTGAQGKGEGLKPSGFVMRAVDHIDSRDGDPTLHTHFVVLNSALCDDGKWRTLDEDALYQAKHAAGAVYRQQMARGLLAAGYGIDSVREQDADGRATGQIWHKVAGIGKAEQRHFSKRRAAIETAMSAQGLSAQEAALRTRKGKQDTPAAVVMAAAAQALAEWKNEGKIEWCKAAELAGLAGQALDVSETDLFESLHKTESAFGRFHFIDGFAKTRLDVSNPVLAADAALAAAVRDGSILELEPDAKGRARFCSKAQWQLEAAITAAAVARKDETRHRLEPSAVRRAIKAHEKRQGFTLTAEQQDAVMWATTGTGGVCALSGRAGTGKTATAGAYIAAFEEAGFVLIGASTAQFAAEKLEAETGLKSMSCARLLDGIGRGTVELTEKSVIVVDEAGMVGAKTLRQIQIKADEAGAKILLLGDALQLQPVEAGSPFRLLTDEIGHAELTDIRRQKNSIDKAVAASFYSGQSGESIVGGWEKRGALAVADDKAGAIQALVGDWMADQRHDADKLIIANTHGDRRAIVVELREALKSAGKLTDETVIEVAGDRIDEKRDLAVAIGDRLRFGKNDRNLGVANGEIAVVEGIGHGKKGLELTLRVESEIQDKAGRVLILPVATYDRLDHAWAATTHAAQGQGKAGVYWLAAAGQGLDRNMGLVAFTRTKEDFHAYTTQKHRITLAERLDAWGTKQGAVEIGLKQPLTPGALDFVADGISKAVEDRKNQKLKADRFMGSIKNEAIEMASLAMVDIESRYATALNTERKARVALDAPADRAREVHKQADRAVQTAKLEMKNTPGFRVFRKANLREQEAKAREDRDLAAKKLKKAEAAILEAANPARVAWVAACVEKKAAETEVAAARRHGAGKERQVEALKALTADRFPGGVAAFETMLGRQTGRVKLAEMKARRQAVERKRVERELMDAAAPGAPTTQAPKLVPRSMRGLTL